MNPVEKAVLPLRAGAIQHAVEAANGLVKKIRGELEAVGWDANIAAPYPRGNLGKRDYNERRAKYHLVRSITKRIGQLSRSPGDPEPVEIYDVGVARLVAEFERAAVDSYDSYVAKLISKVGEVIDAELLVEGTWSYSVLQVTKPNGSKEKWKTRTIVNVSVLGKLFNQWPTRRIR